MYDFETLKAGDKLLKRGRQFGEGSWGYGSPFAMTEWVELTVDKVTPKSYFIGGEKFPKSRAGRNFMCRHYLPGRGGAPERGNSEEFEHRMSLYSKLSGLMPFVVSKLEKLPLEEAAAFADRLKQLDAEIDAAVAG